jgi:hypothetical protein
MLGRRAFLGRLLAAIPLVAAARQLVPVPPVQEWRMNTTRLAEQFEALDITRVDLFDSYEYSWKYVDGYAVAAAWEQYVRAAPLDDVGRRLFTSDA